MNNGNLNKLVTNYPVELTEEEIANLSGTLAPVIAACGGGGGGTGGKIYTGIGFVSVNNTTNQIGLTNEANTKLNQDIPTKVSDLSDSANYQTVAGMTNYLTTATYETDSATFLTKTSAAENLAPISVTADVEALKAASGDFSEYYKKTDTSSKSQLSAKFDKCAKQADLITTISLVNGKQDELTFGYDENNAISSINNSALAGTTYSAGQYINIDTNDTISVTGLVAIDEYATYSGDWNDVSDSYKTYSGSFITKDVNDLTNYYPKTQTSSDSELAEAFGSILKYNVTAAAGIQVTTATDAGVTTYGISMTAEPVVTDTRLSGYNGVAAALDTNISGLWNVGLTQDMLNTINGKLDSTVASQTYQPKGDYVENTDIGLDANNKVTAISGKQLIITAHQSLTNYYTKSETSGATELSTEFAKYLTTAQYNTDSGSFLTGVVTAGSLSGNGTTTYPLGLKTSAEQALLDVDKKITIPTYSNLEDSCKVWNTYSSGWEDLSEALSAEYAITYDAFTDPNYPLMVPENGISGRYDSEEFGYHFGLTTTAINAITSVSSKVDKPDTTQVALNDKYLIYSTLSGEGQPTGWVDMQAKVYSKTEADGTFVSTADVGSGLYYSGSTPKLGVKLGTDLAFDTNGKIQVNTNGTATGEFSFVEGFNTKATASAAHAEGSHTSACATASHTEGVNTYVGGNYGHAEGQNSSAYGAAAHAEGFSVASGDGSHSEGISTSAIGYTVHTQGRGTLFSGVNAALTHDGVSVQGSYNATTANPAVHNGALSIWGNGTPNTRSDAMLLYRDGTVSAKQFQNADGTETINGTTYNFTGVDNIEILPNAATANTANFPDDNVLRFILES